MITVPSQFLNVYYLVALGLCCYARAFSGSGEQGLLLVVVHRLPVLVASLVAEPSSRHTDLSSCGSRAQERGIVVWFTGLVAPQPVESSRATDQTHVPCIGS